MSTEFDTKQDFNNIENETQVTETEHSEKKRGRKNRKNRGTGKRWTKVVSTALVFGLVAGSTMYGVNYAANSVAPVESSSSADTSNSSGTTKTTLTSAKTDSSDSSSSTDSTGSSGQTVESVASSAMPSLVTISTMSVQEMQNIFGQNNEYEVEGAGTGIIVGKNDTELLIATNYHVIEGADTVSIGFIDESVVEASIKGTDSDNDLAVVAVKLSDISDDTLNKIKVITIGDSDDLQLGEQVVAIGNALGYGQSVTSGYVSALNRTLNFSSSDSENGSSQSSSSDSSDEATGLIQTDAAINPGNSGGALLNMNGELVGINEAKSSSTSDGTTVDNMGFAIPISKAEPILEKLMNEETKEKVSEDKQGYMGIKCVDVTSQMSQYYNIPEGVCVSEVEKGSAAENAGIQKGDIITSIGGTSVSSTEDLQSAMEYYAAGDTVKVTVERSSNGEYKDKTVSVTLDAKSTDNT